MHDMELFSIHGYNSGKSMGVGFFQFCCRKLICIEVQSCPAQNEQHYPMLVENVWMHRNNFHYCYVHL